MKIFSTSVIIGLLFWAAVGFTETDLSSENSDSNQSKNTVVKYKRSESYKFGGINLKGQLKKPELGYIYKRKGLREERIVNIPEDFDSEIIQGAGRF